MSVVDEKYTWECSDCGLSQKVSSFGQELVCPACGYEMTKEDWENIARDVARFVLGRNSNSKCSDGQILSSLQKIFKTLCKLKHAPIDYGQVSKADLLFVFLVLYANNKKKEAIRLPIEQLPFIIWSRLGLREGLIVECVDLWLLSRFMIGLHFLLKTIGESNGKKEQNTV